MAALNPSRPRRGPRAGRVLFIATLLLACWLLWGTARGARQARRAETLAGLISPDVEQRKRAAWQVIDHPDPLLVAELEQRAFGNERNPDAREACVYTLGLVRSRSSRAALEHAAQLDENGAVRAAAWLALARLDAGRFAALAQDSRDREDEWTRVGIAQGQLWLFDPAGIEALLSAAANEDHDLRMVATRALIRSVAPLLDAVGRCPADLAAGDDVPLSPDQLALLRQRCAERDLRPIATALHALEASTRDLRREVGRLARARGEAAELLFGP